MTFVFYDTETTGTNTVFDQILQFAAVLTDDQLSPIDSINLRCRILPWVVPAPEALLVTGITPDQLNAPSLPTHYQMITELRAKLEAWSPAVFIGYNSMRFDEDLLRRAFWQCLHPPYLTVTDGNSRIDLFQLVTAAHELYPNALKYPTHESGRTSFKLDQLAPLNGFQHDNAHDALADVYATIHIAKLLKERAAFLWETAVQRAPKDATRDLLEAGSAVAIADHFLNGEIWFGQSLGPHPRFGNCSLVARLDRDWRVIADLDAEKLAKELKKRPAPIRVFGWNKALNIFSLDEVKAHFDIVIPDEQQAMSEVFAADAALKQRVLEAWSTLYGDEEKPEHLEQMIFQGFPSKADDELMDEFHRSSWTARAQIAQRFEDDRFRKLAMRIIYADYPDALSVAEKTNMRDAIGDRLTAEPGSNQLWRTIDQAIYEAKELGQRGDEIEYYLYQRVKAND